MGWHTTCSWKQKFQGARGRSLDELTGGLQYRVPNFTFKKNALFERGKHISCWRGWTQQPNYCGLTISFLVLILVIFWVLNEQRTVFPSVTSLTKQCWQCPFISADSSYCSFGSELCARAYNRLPNGKDWGNTKYSSRNRHSSLAKAVQ